MSRLIDVEKLEQIKFHPLPYTHITPSDADAESYEKGWNDAMDAVIEGVINDTEEVVRCKDCQFSTMTMNGECKYCDVWFPDEKVYLDGEAFCSSGERREE